MIMMVEEAAFGQNISQEDNYNEKKKNEKIFDISVSWCVINHIPRKKDQS